jgi:Ni,Fe-hydrogenase I large subunit
MTAPSHARNVVRGVARNAGAGDRIRKAVTSWAGVESVPHRFGGTEYRYGRKEMGHVHGDRLADLPLPRKLRDQVIAAGRAQPHHVLPQTGWVSCWMSGPDDATDVIELFRMQYDRYTAQNTTNAANRRADPPRGEPRSHP